MLNSRVSRALISSAAAVVALSVLPLPAQAAPIAQGSAKAGKGGSVCEFTVSCGVFKARDCEITAANDIDASARVVNPGAIERTLNWSATPAGPFPPQREVVVVSFSSSCSVLGAPRIYKTSTVRLTFPSGTQSIVLWPVDTFQNFSWSLT